MRGGQGVLVTRDFGEKLQEKKENRRRGSTEPRGVRPQNVDVEVEEKQHKEFNVAKSGALTSHEQRVSINIVEPLVSQS